VVYPEPALNFLQCQSDLCRRRHTGHSARVFRPPWPSHKHLYREVSVLRWHARPRTEKPGTLTL